MRLFPQSSSSIGLTILTILGFLSLAVMSLAHGQKDHDDSHTQMHKLHSIMPIFSDASGKMDSAIEKGDVTEINMQANRILKTVPDLIKTKPHKNHKQIAEYRATAGKLRDDISRVVSFANKGDFASAQRAYRDVQKRCTSCHAAFRD